jgi:hypothetical protein
MVYIGDTDLDPGLDREPVPKRDMGASLSIRVRKNHRIDQGAHASWPAGHTQPHLRILSCITEQNELDIRDNEEFSLGDTECLWVTIRSQLGVHPSSTGKPAGTVGACCLYPNQIVGTGRAKRLRYGALDGSRH